MGILDHAAVSRKMLAHGRHAGPTHALGKGTRQTGNGLRVLAKGAVADHLTDAALYIQHRGKAEIDINGTQFCRHQPSGFFHQIYIARGIVSGSRRQAGETLAEALDAAAFVIDGDQQFWASGAYRRDQFDDLLGRFIVATEQDDATGSGLAQAFLLLECDDGALDIEHDRAWWKVEMHGVGIRMRLGFDGRVVGCPSCPRAIVAAVPELAGVSVGLRKPGVARGWLQPGSVPSIPYRACRKPVPGLRHN